jgi:hypothetical protein
MRISTLSRPGEGMMTIFKRVTLGSALLAAPAHEENREAKK